MANPNVIPKSLHTVTVLITMARMVLESGAAITNADAVYKALDQAIKKLNKI